MLPPTAAVPLACGACLVAAAATVVAADPTDGGNGLLVCPYRAATGLWCPGCGFTRSVHFLARGQVLHALSLNVLAPLFLVAIALAWWTWLCVTVHRSVPRVVARTSIHVSKKPVVAATTLVVVFTVVRNLPGVEVLRGG